VKTLLSKTKQLSDDDTQTVALSTGLHTPQPSAGRKLGRYVIRETIGRGAMGEVYLGWDDVLQREVAIKLPRRDQFKSDQELERFLREARVVAKLQHPSIVTIYDIGHDSDSTPYIVMENVRGTTLERLLEKEKPTYDQARALIAPIAEALQFAHATGFVHRDVKPGNILIDVRGNPRLADFGLAIHEDEQYELAGAVSGSLAYMAPEQVRGETHHLDGRTDIWALGVVLYELVAGRRPFRGRNSNELVDEILNRDPKPLRMIDESVPADLELVCMKCLQKRIADRYSTAGDILVDLGSSGTSMLEKMHDMCGGDRALAREFAEALIAETPQDIADMRHGLRAGDKARLHQCAHTLKNAFSFAPDVQALASVIETCARDENVNHIERLLPDLEGKVKRVLDQLIKEVRRLGER
jgi:serine/threonine protein kinase